MKKTNSFRQLVDCSGSFLSIGSPVVTEIAAQYPFAWLLLDMEHGGFSEATIIDHLRVLTHTQVMSIVRVPAVDPVLIGRVLDSGADGIMVPHVVSAQQVDACKSAMYYLPEGRRGFSSSARQYAYGTKAPDDLSSLDKPLLFAQIEDVEGVINASEIAAADAVDVLFVGPADLKLALKQQASNRNEITFERSLQLVAGAAAAHQKKSGILLRDRSQIEPMRQLGFNCIALDSDIAILKSGYERIMKDLHN